MPREAVADGSTSHAQEGRSGKAIEEAGHEGGGHILRDGAGDQPNEKEAVGDDVDRSTAVKLAQPSANWKCRRTQSARLSHVLQIGG